MRPALQPTPAYWAYMPQMLRGFARPFPTPADGGDVATPTATETATRVPRPTRTPTPTPESIEYPTDDGAIILQIGWTYTEAVGQVWQEMEGTPWLTLYGDGRLIAGHELLDRAQPLYDGRLADHDVKRWMNDLAYRVTFFSLNEAYDHPESTKPSLHVYARVTAGSWRVTLRGWDEWTSGSTPSIPGGGDAARLVRYVQGLEDEASTLPPAPYVAESTTVLAQQLRPSLVPGSPPWPVAGVDVAAIADSAPLAKPSPIDRLVGHLFVDEASGAAVRAAVLPVAERNFPFEYRAAEFLASGRPIAVGARQEVPGGSLFLPPNIREGWYRADRGSGVPPLRSLRLRLDP
jgi:hypothetical protein